MTWRPDWMKPLAYMGKSGRNTLYTLCDFFLFILKSLALRSNPVVINRFSVGWKFTEEHIDLEI